MEFDFRPLIWAGVALAAITFVAGGLVGWLATR